MNKKFTIASALLLSIGLLSPAKEYTTGVLFINEDWYGHQNSTVNHLEPDDPEGVYWDYRVIQNNNPGVELGCTNQYGALWEGRLYLIAKQDKDPGATITGGRITVADGTTMKVIKQLTHIDPSGQSCDGRGFVGVTPDKGYISSSNGVWVFDLNTLEVTGQVEGTENPNGVGNGDNTDSSGPLYHGQCGSMVSTNGKVFVAHQSNGLLVVDPIQDKVVETISMKIIDDITGNKTPAGIGSVVQAKDGSLWVSVARDIQGMGNTLPYLIKVDPRTLETEVVTVDKEQGLFPPANSWYAWTPDGFCSSVKSNTLFWNGGKNSWFSAQYIFKMDVDTREITRIIDLEADNENWKLYGCSMRPHPLTDELYVSLIHEFVDPTYITRRYTSDGECIFDYDMIQNYWFPSLPIFPEDPRNHFVYNNSGIHMTANIDTGSEIRFETADGCVRVINGTGECVYVYDMNGTQICTTRISSGFHTIDTSALPVGIYVIRCADKTYKFIHSDN